MGSKHNKPRVISFHDQRGWRAHIEYPDGSTSSVYGHLDKRRTIERIAMTLHGLNEKTCVVVSRQAWNEVKRLREEFGDNYANENPNLPF